MVNITAGKGALFKNEKGDVLKRPDYTGIAKILNKDFLISAWINTSQSGKKYLSLVFNNPEDKDTNIPK